MDQKNTTSGSMKISVNVIKTIVKNVLSEIEGVHSLAACSACGAGFRMPIEISLDVEIAVVNVAVNCCYGCRLKDVAKQIQVRVKDTIQDMTGIAVSRVNVLIADIRMKETE
ncbi:MAG: Asp23/Gls24 family envelope stress response protein [Candidatus Merdivicinus sp.]|jgi:uncharacterized alkaline shock family protein YloU